MQRDAAALRAGTPRRGEPPTWPAGAPDLRKWLRAPVLNSRLRVDAVGDRAVVTGDGRGLGVDLVGEQGEGSCDAGFGGCLEGDGNRSGGEGDGSGQAADDGFAGDG